MKVKEAMHLCNQETMLVLKRDVNSVPVAGTYYTVDYQVIVFFKQGLTYLFNLLWLTSPRLLCPLGKSS